MGGGSGPTLQKRVVPFLQKVMIDENNPNARFLQMFKESQVSVVSSDGNKYVFNSRSTYNENVKYVLNNGTYTFMGVPNTHPIAILNAGKTDLITYSGDPAKKSTKSVTGTTADGTYDFYYGDVEVTVSGNFKTLSVFCYNHGYMGGENLLKHGQDTVDSIINNLSTLFDVPVKFLSNINNPIMISRDGSTITVLLEKVKTSFSEITEITILSFKNNTYDLSSFTDFTPEDALTEKDYWFPVTVVNDYYTPDENTNGRVGISFTMAGSGRITENFTTGKDPYSFDVTKDETYSFSYYYDESTNTPTNVWIVNPETVSLPTDPTAANQISRNQSFEASAFSNEITYTNLPDYSTIDDLTVDIYVGESDQTTPFAAITDSSNGAQAGDSFGLKYNLAFGPESYEPSPQDGATYDFGSFTPVDDGLSITASYYYGDQGYAAGNVVTELPNTDNGNYYAEIKYVMSGVTGGSDIETAYVAQGLTVGNTAGGLKTDGNSILFAYTFGLTGDVKDYSSEADGDSANFKVTADGSSGDLTISARDFTF